MNFEIKTFCVFFYKEYMYVFNLRTRLDGQALLFHTHFFAKKNLSFISSILMDNLYETLHFYC